MRRAQPSLSRSDGNGISSRSSRRRAKASSRRQRMRQQASSRGAAETTAAAAADAAVAAEDESTETELILKYVSILPPRRSFSFLLHPVSPLIASNIRRRPSSRGSVFVLLPLASGCQPLPGRPCEQKGRREREEHRQEERTASREEPLKERGAKREAQGERREGNRGEIMQKLEENCFAA